MVRRWQSASRWQAVALVSLIAAPATAGDRSSGRPFATRSVVYARHGMVASMHPLASQAGVDVLKAGGSAVDAAIAMNAALGFLEPVSCGIGGDLFALVWDAKARKLHALVASGAAPRALTADKIPPEPDGTIPLYTPYGWTVPGTPDGWFELHGKFGRLPMTDVLAPAARMAREGEPVPQTIAGAWGRSIRLMGQKPGFAEVFLPGGRAPKEGEVFKNPALARAYEALARGGRDVFYKGEIARDLVAFSQKVGGFFAMEDLAAHRSHWVEPISTEYRGVRVFEIPPPTQGVSALQMLNMLEGYDLAAMGRHSAAFWHTLVEIKKIAYEDRARFVADPEFAKIPIAGLLSKEYAKERAKLVDPARAQLRIEAGHPPLGEGDTTYLATADAEGNMVSLIQSNYTGFGSGYVLAPWGFGIHSRGALFDLKPGRPNSLEPGKRPFHTIIPAFAMRGGEPWLAFGVMGGDMQPQGHVQVILNLVDFGMNLQEAGDAPRFHHEDSSEPTGTLMTKGGLLHVESGVAPEIRRDLAAMGHVIQESVGRYGGYQAIAWDPKERVWAGASESRRDGAAIGY
jgi:gamma-glutamyltranspeptidase / glutathione hydrolase